MWRQRNTMKTFKEQKVSSRRGECSVKEWDLLAWGHGRQHIPLQKFSCKPKKCILGLVVQGNTTAF